MATNDSTAKITEIPVTKVTKNLYEIGTLIIAIRNLARQRICNGDDGTGASDVGIKSLAEKAGYLSDKCINLLGDPTGSVGDFDAWTNLGEEESTDEAQEAA